MQIPFLFITLYFFYKSFNIPHVNQTLSTKPLYPNDTFRVIVSNNDLQDPIDIVYTWVNGSDPLFKKSFLNLSEQYNVHMDEKSIETKYIDNDELRFSLRSIEKYAIHMIRYIFIVVANNESQIPTWLDTRHPKIRIITHRQIFGEFISPETDQIFNFNSDAIENCITNIPGLSNEFIYFNDDCYLGRTVQKSDFFDRAGYPKIYVKERSYKNFELQKEILEMKAKKDFGALQFEASLSNTIALFKRRFESVADFVHVHVAYPSTKALINECKENFKDEIKRTILQPFRTVKDIKMQFITFQCGMSFNQIEAVDASNDRARFIVIDNDEQLSQLDELARERPILFCINCDSRSHIQRVKALLYLWFSKPSSFELRKAKLPSIDANMIKYWENQIVKYSL